MVEHKRFPSGTALASAEDRAFYLQAVIDSLDDEITVIDRDYRIIIANELFLYRHGETLGNVVGKYCYDITHGPADFCMPPHERCPLKIAFETGKPAEAYHTHVYYHKGEKRERYLHIMAHPVTDSQGRVIAIIEQLRDTTEAKVAGDLIAEASESLSALNAIATVVSKSLDLDTVLNSALDKTLEIMKCDIGGILLRADDGHTLVYRVYRGLSDTFVGEMSLHLGEGIAGRVAETGDAILSEDISQDPRAYKPRVIAAEGLRAFASVPLRAREKTVGVLNVASHESRKFSVENIRLLESIAAQIAIAIENAQLHQQVQKQDEVRGELLREIFAIQEEERKRIARELHDETSQSLASVAATLEAVTSALPPGSDGVKTQLKKVQALSLSILDEIHRLTYELRPTLLDDLGLVAATRWLTDNILGEAGVKVDFRISGRKKRLPHQVETGLFRVVQESVNNIARHSGARNASLTLHFQKNAIRVHISDDGGGFDVEEAITSKERPRGLGLLGMKERIALLNGTLDIRSRPGGGGTEVDVKIPLG